MMRDAGGVKALSAIDDLDQYTTGYDPHSQARMVDTRMASDVDQRLGARGHQRLGNVFGHRTWRQVHVDDEPAIPGKAYGPEPLVEPYLSVHPVRRLGQA